MGEKVATSPSKVADAFCRPLVLIETPVYTCLSVDICYLSFIDQRDLIMFFNKILFMYRTIVNSNSNKEYVFFFYLPFL